MRGVEFDNYGKVLDGYFYFLKFLIGASDDIVGSYISLIKIEQPMAIFDGFFEHAFLHIGAGSDEEGFSMCWIEF